MTSVALVVFFAAMLVASVGHVLAYIRRHRVLNEMHDALVAAGQPRGGRAKVAPFEGEEGIPAAEHLLAHGVLVGRAPELHGESEVSNPETHSVRHVAV